ncbi:MAG: PstS family phosphate ABC transporter substrate-binding protein [Acidobacteriota bacterium]
MKKTFLTCLTVVVGMGLVFGIAGAAKTITIKGSTTVLPIAQSCAEAFMNQHSDIDISVAGGGSGVGIASIIDGTADIGDASRSIKDSEREKAKSNGIDTYENIVAADGIAVIVNPKNTVSELTLDQIKAIYTGKINNWKEVGGANKRIVIVSRDSSSGTFEAFNELALDKEKVRPDALMNASNNIVAQIVANTPLAIGYIGIGYISESIKAVTVNGITCTKENVVNGTYPIARNLYMYTKGSPAGVVKEFIDFILSPEGQKLVDKAGFVAIK